MDPNCLRLLAYLAQIPVLVHAWRGCAYQAGAKSGQPLTSLLQAFRRWSARPPGMLDTYQGLLNGPVVPVCQH